jgi:hypothetical protein
MSAARWPPILSRKIGADFLSPHIFLSHFELAKLELFLLVVKICQLKFMVSYKLVSRTQNIERIE